MVQVVVLYHGYALVRIGYQGTVTIIVILRRKVGSVNELHSAVDRLRLSIVSNTDGAVAVELYPHRGSVPL
ncbi:MAG: hypothetical protein IJ559_07845 [Prevotella sp.]|nr:hypothetical protein [Prevotella sp.]